MIFNLYVKLQYNLSFSEVLHCMSSIRSGKLGQERDSSYAHSKGYRLFKMWLSTQKGLRLKVGNTKD